MRSHADNAAADSFLRRYLCLGFNRVDADPFSVATELFVFHNAVNHGKKSVITPQADILAGMDHSANLPHEDIAGPDNLPAEPLDPPPL